MAYIYKKEAFNFGDKDKEAVTTSLHYACVRGDLKVFRMLVKDLDVDVNAAYCIQVDELDLKYPLHVAAENRKEEVTLALINEFGANCEVEDGQGQTVLHYACKGGSASLVQTLIREHNASPSAYDNDGKTPLHVAAANGKEEVALALINEFDADCNSKDKQGQSILHHACMGGNLNLVQTLCGLVEDVDVNDDYKRTPLCVAAAYGKEEIALTLIKEFGADCNTEDSLGRSVLHHASIGDNVNSVQTLTSGNNVNLVQTLICEHSADVNARDNDRRTPLHLAAWNWSSTEVVSALIEHNASLLVADNDNNTPLHVCAYEGNEKCVDLLLSFNAPVLIRNHEGKTPYDLAKNKYVKEKLKKYLQENKAKLLVDYERLRENSKKKYSGSKHLTRIFVIGDPGAGKSSLIESLKREGFFQALWSVSESSVPPHTAGIIPSVYISKHYGRVIFYDFAGDREYYSSHAAILESVTSSKRGVNIFVIVLDLRVDEESLTSTLHSWLLLIENQNIDVVKPYLVIVGSHKDLISEKALKEKTKSFERFREIICSKFKCSYSCFMLNCCKPGSKDIGEIQSHFVSLTKMSPLHKLSIEASILFGLLEKDFSNATNCSISDLTSHIKITGVGLIDDPKVLYPLLYELHEIGLLFLIHGSSSEEVQIIPNISLLTNKVHKSIFSEEAKENIFKQCKEKFGFSLNIGLVPKELIPAGITKECLIQLQYCQEIKHEDIGVFSSIPQPFTLNQSLLFFPAFITLDKSDVTWTTPSDFSYSVGWLAKCADFSHHFSSRFLHVLLLRLVFRFTLSVPTRPQTASSSLPHSLFQRRCTLWKTGVHWPMEEGVDCMVELVNNSKGVVVITRSGKDLAEKCSSVLCKIIDCVMEAKAEFCHAITPYYYLLGSTEEADNYLSEDNLFSLSDVERVLASKDKERVLSITGNKELKRSDFLFVRNFTYWVSLFPIDFACVLDYLKDVVKDLMNLGHYLNVPRGILEAIELAHPRDVDSWSREIVRGWISSSQDPPCWWQLIEALKQIGKNVLAQKIEQEHSVHVQLQKKLLNEENHSITPDKDFLDSFSGVVGSKWPSIASLLSLSSSEIEEIKKEGHKRDYTLCMLKKWVTKEGATYGQLCQRLKSISLLKN